MAKLTSALLAGTAMTLTITQGANSASAQVSSWGTTTAGTISIELTRTRGMVAPDSVAFSVNTENSLFETPLEHPESTVETYGQQYFPRHHDLIYLWDFYGDAAWADVPEADREWSAPTRLPPGCASRRYAKGPTPMHVYREGGTYTASVLVYEPSSGLWATASATVEVAKPEDFYLSVVAFDTDAVPTATDADLPEWVRTRAAAGDLRFDGFQEAYISFIFTVSSANRVDGGGPSYYGFVDSSFGGAPARPDNGNKTLFLWKRGKSYGVYFENQSPNIHGIDAYGTGAAPVWNRYEGVLPGGAYAAKSSRVRITSSAASIAPELHIANIDMRGGFDPTVANFPSTLPSDVNVGFYTLGDNITVVADKISLTGLCDSLYADQKNGIFHINDTIVTKRGNYGTEPVGQEGGETGFFGYTGVNIANPPGTVEDGYIAAGIRAARANLLYVSHCNIVTTEQPAYRLQDMGGAQAAPLFDSNMYVFDSIGEGGSGGGTVSIYTNGRYPNIPNLGNTIIDGCIFIPRAKNGGHIVYLAGMGVTIRNCIFQSFIGAKTGSAIAVQRRGDVDLSDQAAMDAFLESSEYVSPEVFKPYYKARVAPNKFYGNTFIHYDPINSAKIITPAESIRMVSLRDDPALAGFPSQFYIYSYWPQDQWGDNVEFWPEVDTNVNLAAWIADGNLAGINYELDETSPLLDAWGNPITISVQAIYTYNGPGDITETPVSISPAYVLSGKPSGSAPNPSGVARTTTLALGPALGETIADWIENQPGDRDTIGARNLT